MSINNWPKYRGQFGTTWWSSFIKRPNAQGLL